MSTDLNFTRAIRLLSDLNIVSQSSHPSDANIEFMERQLAQVISAMVSNNRDRAYERSIYAENIRRAISTGYVAVRRPNRQAVTAFSPQPNNPLEKTKVIAKKKLEEPCPAECAICQETPKFKDAVCTDCEHYYCKTCWTGWMNADGSNKSCPTCRKDMPRTTSYRARKVSRKPAVATVSDDEM